MWTVRSIIDLSFFLIVNVILLNVFFGVIIDKFGAFRDERMVRILDRENVCYVCGKDRSEISLFADFAGHITSHHNIEDYLKYYVYVRELAENGEQHMTGVQRHVLSLMKENSFDWFPIGQSLQDPKNKSS